jgi:hypothetical protein
MQYFHIEQTSGQWIFITLSPKITLKDAVLLHDGNKVTSVPLAQQFT